ncbi:nucleoside transporter C-terminal domain-containing protein [Ectobacillus antri]|nr:nucleoside transporter C-terminal domain-containing protein [Ectobacillus antri]
MFGYAVLYGFTTLSSVALFLGGVGGMAPSRCADIARYGLRAIITGMFI